ncbi:Integrin alpha-11, partial [Larimichthys crocea]
DQSDIQIECFSEDRLANQRRCNISAPFMKSLSQVSFRLEFEFSRSVFLDHARVVMTTSSDGEDGYPDDNTNDIFLPLKYQTDLLFTRDPNPPRFEIRSDSSSSSSSSSSWDLQDSSSPTFNLTYYIQNLGIFSVQDIVFKADIWAVTRKRNQLVNITDYSIEQVAGSHCTLHQPRTTNEVTAEDLSHLSQLNHSNSGSLPVQCRLNLPASRELKVTLRGRLQLPALLAVSFRSLEVLTAASIQLEASSVMFLQEDRPVRKTSTKWSVDRLSGDKITLRHRCSLVSAATEETGRGGAACSQWEGSRGVITCWRRRCHVRSLFADSESQHNKVINFKATRVGEEHLNASRAATCHSGTLMPRPQLDQPIRTQPFNHKTVDAVRRLFSKMNMMRRQM